MNILKKILFTTVILTSFCGFVYGLGDKEKQVPVDIVSDETQTHRSIIDYSLFQETRNVESVEIESDERDSRKVEIISKLLAGGSRTVDAYIGSLKIAQLENEFSVLTDTFSIEEIRKTWDWVDSGVNGLSLAGIAVGGVLSLDDGTQSEGLALALSSATFGLLFQFVDSWVSPEVNSTTQKIALQLAVARQGYDDLIIRKKQYAIILSELENIQKRLNEIEIVFQTASSSESADILLTDEVFLSKIISLSEDLNNVALSILTLLESMKTQAEYYVEITRDVAVHNSKIQILVDQYIDFIGTINGAIQYHKNIVLPDFSEMMITLNALSLIGFI